MTSEEIRKWREGNQQAIELADRAIKQIDETLRDTGERLERARAVLRRAGYLR